MFEEKEALKEQEMMEKQETLEEQEEIEEQDELDEEVIIGKAKESEKEEQTKKTIIEVFDGIKCKYCGFGNEKTATYCSQCGQAINKES